MAHITIVLSGPQDSSDLSACLEAWRVVPGCDLVLIEDASSPCDAPWLNRHFPHVRLLRVPPPLGANLGAARNAASAGILTPWVAFLSTELLPVPQFFARISPLLPDIGYSFAVDGLDASFGSWLCPTRLFHTMGGFDEAITDPALQERDLLLRLRLRNLEDVDLPNGCLRLRPTGTPAPANRTAEPTAAAEGAQRHADRVYVELKCALLHLARTDIHAVARNGLRTQIGQRLAEPAGATQSIAFSFGWQPLDADHDIERQVVLKIRPRPSGMPPPSAPADPFSANHGFLTDSSDSASSSAVPPRDTSQECPVFLLSTTGRTGSTLVQRLITSTHQVMMWGEHGGQLIPSFRQNIELLAQWRAREGAGHFELFRERGLDAFIPNINPPLPWFMRGVGAALQESLGGSAADMGFPRWGFKEIRYDGQEARFLHTVFPKGRFIVLARDPRHVLRSIKSTQWYGKDPHAFLTDWATRTVSLLDALPELGPGLLLRYEDLLSNREATLEILADHLSIDLNRVDRSLFETVHRGSSVPPRNLEPADFSALAEPRVRQAAERLGYVLD